jgi:hypothetical protein
VVAAPHSDPLTAVPVRQALNRRYNRLARRLSEPGATWLASLVVVTATVAVGLLVVPMFPVTAIVVPLVIANLVLSPRTLPWFVVYSLGGMVLAVAANAQTSLDGRRVTGVVIAFVVGLIILVASFRRSRLGVSGGMGESMLMDLRDRINNQGRLPDLPPGWYADAVLRSAGGSSFAGDLMVAARSRDQQLLQVAVVDVSGKGEQAGTRALLLSGSFGGLLGALPKERFLPAANDYLVRQDWGEGFATAVHLVLDLTTGEFEIRSAGHPPAVQLHAGTRSWGVHEVDGPALGLIANAEFGCVRGTVQPGDALLLFTDGLVETPDRDISLGIEMLLTESAALMDSGVEQGAMRLIDELGSSQDDCALLLVHRR